MKTILSVLFLIAALPLFADYQLQTATATGLHFKQEGKGGMYRASLPDAFGLPEGAKVSFDKSTNVLSWVVPAVIDAEGNEVTPETVGSYTITEADIAAAIVELTTPKPLPVPESVTRLQMRAWLILNDYDAEAVIGSLPETTPDEIKAKKIALLRWSEAEEYDRDDALVIQVATALGMDSDTIDQAFREASQLYND